MAKRGRPKKIQPHTTNNTPSPSKSTEDSTQMQNECASVETVHKNLNLEAVMTPAPPIEVQPRSYSSVVANGDGAGELQLQFQETVEIEGKNYAQIDFDDIKSEVEFWKSALVCCVAGANPPFNVMSGFLHRIWSEYHIKQVSCLPDGIFLVKFDTVQDRDRVIQQRIFFFDHKPLLMKEWSETVKLNRESIESLPIWIRFPGLEPKYWGAPSLGKLGSVIGNPIKMDQHTRDKTILNYARILVDVRLDKELPDYVDYVSEQGIIEKQQVEFEWKPTFCTHCNMFGHKEEECRKKNKIQRVWQPKQKAPRKSTEKDAEGFQMVGQPRDKPTHKEPCTRAEIEVEPSQFQILQDVTEDEIEDRGEDGNGVRDPPPPT